MQLTLCSLPIQLVCRLGALLGVESLLPCIIPRLRTSPVTLMTVTLRRRFPSTASSFACAVSVPRVPGIPRVLRGPWLGRARADKMSQNSNTIATSRHGHTLLVHMIWTGIVASYRILCFLAWISRQSPRNSGYFPFQVRGTAVVNVPN